MPKQSSPVKKSPAAARRSAITREVRESIRAGSEQRRQGEDAVARRTFLAELDVRDLIQLLQEKELDATAPYYQLYNESRERFLEENGLEAVNFAKLLRSVDASAGVEAAIRDAGFVVGFQTCRQLMLGELDLEAIKAGAR